MLQVDPVPHEPSHEEEDNAPEGADKPVSGPAKDLEMALADNKRLKVELSVMRKRLRDATKVLAGLKKDPDVQFPADVDPVTWESLGDSSSGSSAKSVAKSQAAGATQGAAKDPA